MAGENPELFELGPPQRIRRRLVLVAAGRSHVIRRAIMVIVIGWLPLLIMTALGPNFHSFALDISASTRSLIAAPLLVLAEITCATYLTAIAGYFLDANMIATDDIPRFKSLIASTRRSLNALPVEMLVVVLSYFLIFLAFAHLPREMMPAWQVSETGIAGFSIAGWWNILVSLPLLIMPLIGWLWRWMLWVRFLWVTSRLNLDLVPSHPDHMAGLSFVGHSLRAYSTVVLALSTIVAGRVANEVLLGASPFAHKFLLAGTGAAVIIIFTAPLYVFAKPLRHAWHRGIALYGELASYLGRDFEKKWFNRQTRAELDGLDASDFSALTDLYQVATSAYEMKLSPIDVKSMFTLVIAMLLPFAPVIVMTVPADVILKDLVGFLL